jgi:hypothetical protein
LLADRLCANTTASVGTCFGNKPGPCEDGRCRPLPGDPRVEDSCYPRQPLLARGRRAFEPYTVYLNHPCDLAANYEHCVHEYFGP